MRKLVTILLTLTMIFSLSIPSLAAYQENTTEIPITLDSDASVTVILPNDLKDEFNVTEIEELVRDNDLCDGDIITIYEIGTTSETPPDTQPRFLYSYKTTKSSGAEWKAQNYFVTSVAKGQTTTLSSKFSKTLTTSITVGEAFAKADIGGSITAEYSVTHQFVGPPETSSYNTREFRVQFYAKTVSFTQQKINVFGDVVDTTSGKANVPTRYALYSIDRKI